MKTHPRKKSGFAMVTAIILMALCAMSLTTLSVTLYTQSRRTQSAIEDAQLRQLLEAGATFALAHSLSNSTAHITIPLPDTLQQRSAQLTIDITPGPSANQQSADIEASLPNHRDSQHLLLTLQSNTWQITEADPHN